jgi:hypothetical protein
LFGAPLSEMTARNEYSVFIDNRMRQRILHWQFDRHYADVVIYTRLQSANPNDPTPELSVATSARLALDGSGTYLQQRLAANSAAPTDLTNAVNAVADTIRGGVT